MMCQYVPCGAVVVGVLYIRCYPVLQFSAITHKLIAHVNRVDMLVLFYAWPDHVYILMFS